MSDFLNDEYDNETLLTEDEKRGLKLRWITTRAELNNAEAQGIVHSQQWLMKIPKRDILSEKFLRDLHKQMFGEIWTWAGVFRSTEKNIGIAPHAISEQLRMLFDDTKYWIKHKTFSDLEIAMRFHHRLVAIHPFSNGNGRIARLMTNLLMKQMSGKILRWGTSKLEDVSNIRTKYIEALRRADNRDYSALIDFISENQFYDPT